MDRFVVEKRPRGEECWPVLSRFICRRAHGEVVTRTRFLTPDAGEAYYYYLLISRCSLWQSDVTSVQNVFISSDNESKTYEVRYQHCYR